MTKEQKKETYAIRRALLKNLIAQHEGKKKEIAEAIGLPQQGHLSRYYTADNNARRNITDTIASKIEDFFQLPEGWLSNPENLTLKQRQFLDIKTAIQTPYTNQTYPPSPIPLLTSSNAIDYLHNPKKVGVRDYTSSTTYHSPKAIAVIMPDQSMYNPLITPSLSKDDILIVEPNITPISGDIVFVLNNANQTCFFAQLLVNAHGDRSITHINPEMVMSFDLTEQTKIIGVVIERQTRFYSQAGLSQRINM